MKINVANKPKETNHFKRLAELALFLIGVFLFTGCVSLEQPKLPPNHLIDGTYMNIHSPNSHGWMKIDHSNYQVVFAKRGIKDNESYIAKVTFFPLPAIKTEEEFLHFIQTNASKQIDKKRFSDIKTNFTLYKQRSYTCVMAQELYKDKMAKTSSTNTEELLMQNKSLYCKDPKREEAGFTVGYSYRGESIIPTFDLEADSFIDGVRFPKYN